MTIAYFSISGLDILGALEDFGAEKKNELVDWIYSLQVRTLSSHHHKSKSSFAIKSNIWKAIFLKFTGSTLFLRPEFISEKYKFEFKYYF